jgi:acyl carrier protein
VQRTDIYAKVVDIIVHLLKVNREAIKEDTTLESLGADSLNRVEFVMELEEAFGLEVNDEEAEKFSTVKDTIDYIQQHTQSL